MSQMHRWLFQGSPFCGILEESKTGLEMDVDRFTKRQENFLNAVGSMTLLLL